VPVRACSGRAHAALRSGCACGRARTRLVCLLLVGRGAAARGQGPARAWAVLAWRAGMRHSCAQPPMERKHHGQTMRRRANMPAALASVGILAHSALGLPEARKANTPQTPLVTPPWLASQCVHPPSPCAPPVARVSGQDSADLDGALARTWRAARPILQRWVPVVLGERAPSGPAHVVGHAPLIVISCRCLEQL